MKTGPIFAAAMLLGAPCAYAQSTYSGVPRTVNSALATLGINSHGVYNDWVYNGAYNVTVDVPGADTSVAPSQGVIQALAYLSNGTPAFAYVRDNLLDHYGGTTGGYYTTWYSALVAAGVKFDMGTGGGGGSTGSITTSVSAMDLSYVAGQGGLRFYEGPNEICETSGGCGNNDPEYAYDGMLGNAAGIEWTKEVYQAAVAAKVGVYGLDFTSDTAPDQCVLAQYADSYNAHPYPNNGNTPEAYMLNAVSTQYGDVPSNCPYGKVVSFTEDGYASTDAENIGTSLAYASDRQNGGGDVNNREISQTAQGELELNMVADSMLVNSRAFILYQLLPELADTSGTNEDAEYAMFNEPYTLDGSGNADYGYTQTGTNTLTPKPIALYIHNLMGLMKDTTTGNGGVGITYTNSAAGTGVSDLPLETNDGKSFEILTWQEAGPQWTVSNNGVTADTFTNAPNIKNTLSFPKPVSRVQFYSPLATGSMVIGGCTNCSSVSFSVGPYVIVARVTP